MIIDGGLQADTVLRTVISNAGKPFVNILEVNLQAIYRNILDAFGGLETLHCNNYHCSMCSLDSWTGIFHRVQFSFDMMMMKAMTILLTHVMTLVTDAIT